MEKCVDYVVRKAVKADCAAICDLINKSAKHKGDEDRTSTSVLEKDGFDDEKEPYFYAVVVESIEPKKIVGYSIYYFVYSTWNGPIGYLEDIFVEESWWNEEIITEIIELVISAILDKDCRQCRLACLASNEKYMKLYKLLGALNLKEHEGWLMLHFDNAAIQTMKNS